MKPTYTSKEAAEMLGISVVTVNERIRKGVLKAHKKYKQVYSWKIDADSLMKNLSLKSKGIRRNIQRYVENT